MATLLDLAPWELPATYAASPAARFGHRLRARVLRDAAGVIVCSRAVAESSRRRLHIREERLAVVQLAVDDEFRAALADAPRLERLRQPLALPSRYLAFSGRYDARKDFRTLLQAVALLRTRSASASARQCALPALVVALEAGHAEEQRLVERAIAAAGVGELVTIAPVSGTPQRAAVLAGSEGLVYPALSESTAVPVLEALAIGMPVICTRVGALPESVGSAGIVVEPRDPTRMAAALEALWATGSLAQQLHRQARRRADAAPRTWSDVARETRLAYAAAVRGDGPPAEGSSRVRSALGRFGVR